MVLMMCMSHRRSWCPLSTELNPLAQKSEKLKEDLGQMQWLRPHTTEWKYAGTESGHLTKTQHLNHPGFQLTTSSFLWPEGLMLGWEDGVRGTYGEGSERWAQATGQARSLRTFWWVRAVLDWILRALTVVGYPIFISESLKWLAQHHLPLTRQLSPSFPCPPASITKSPVPLPALFLPQCLHLEYISLLPFLLPGKSHVFLCQYCSRQHLSQQDGNSHTVCH